MHSRKLGLSNKVGRHNLTEATLKYDPKSIEFRMIDTVKKAMDLINARRFNFEVFKKIGHSGKMDDVYTDIDPMAQGIFVTELGGSFPFYGIVAEEGNLKVRCKILGVRIFFTFDPLDGTSALIRGSHEIASMAALVYNKKVIAAYVGDVVSGEIYGFGPDFFKVMHITGSGLVRTLEISSDRKLSEQYVLLRSAPEKQNPLIRRMIAGKTRTFKGIGLAYGSIGTAFARLWRGEFGALVLNPTYMTPWDSAPVVGISEKLGFVFLKIVDGKLVRYNPRISSKVRLRSFDILVVHKSRLKELGLE